MQLREFLSARENEIHYQNVYFLIVASWNILYTNFPHNCQVFSSKSLKICQIPPKINPNRAANRPFSYRSKSIHFESLHLELDIFVGAKAQEESEMIDEPFLTIRAGCMRLR
jgi:hypothetical protein